MNGRVKGESNGCCRFSARCGAVKRAQLDLIELRIEWRVGGGGREGGGGGEEELEGDEHPGPIGPRRLMKRHLKINRASDMDITRLTGKCNDLLTRHRRRRVASRSVARWSPASIFTAFQWQSNHGLMIAVIERGFHPESTRYIKKTQTHTHTHTHKYN